MAIFSSRIAGRAGTSRMLPDMKTEVKMMRMRRFAAAAVVSH
jgi:hypothetical protein